MPHVVKIVVEAMALLSAACLTPEIEDSKCILSVEAFAPENPLL